MRNISSVLRNSFMKMGFFKRSIFTLALGLAAVIAVGLIFEALYNLYFTNGGFVIAAGLIGSQVWLYKPHKSKSAQGSAVPRQSAAQGTNPMQVSESQIPAEGTPQRTTLEEEVESLGNDFSVDDGELVDGEDPR